MGQNKYTKEQVNFVLELVRDKGMNVTPATRIMCKHFEMEYNENIGRLFRQKMSDLGFGKQTIESSKAFKQAKKRKFDETKKVFFFTLAQSYSEVNLKMLASMEHYAEFTNAGIHVIAGRYNNPTSLEKSSRINRNEESNSPWGNELYEYLDANRQNIHSLITCCSDLKIQPTAVTPLSGLNGITGLESCIVGHPRMQLNVLPVLDGYPPKIILTTGAITKPDYTDTKAGAKGNFHHQYGFVIVELDGDNYHVRQVKVSEKGEFYDLKYRVTPKRGVEVYSEKPKAIVFGDLHLGEEDKKAVKTSFKMAKELNVETIVLHDVFNGHSISHHEKKNPFKLLEREGNGSWSLSTEIKYMKKWFKENSDYNYVVVRSNHDDFLDRWLINDDWRKSSNRAEYLKYANILASGKAKKGIIPYILEKRFSNVKALGVNESYRVGDIECGMHGHLGNGGSRGSAIQFKNLNTKNITGHTHTPICVDGHMSVGTLTPRRAEYVQGPCSWDQANIIIYPNGKASHLFIRNGKYTTFY